MPLLVVTLLAVFAPPAATAAETPAPAKGLVLQGSVDKPRPISVSRVAAKRQDDGDENAARNVGELTLMVQNTGASAVTVALRYFRDGVAPANVPGAADVALLGPDSRPLTAPPKVAAGALRQLDLRFTLPADASPFELDGTIAIVPSAVKKGQQPGAWIVVEVVGEAAKTERVAFDPPTATVRVGCLAIRWICSGEGDVRIEGAGVAETVRSIAAAGGLPEEVDLWRNGRVGTSPTFESFEVDPDDPSAATATLDSESEVQAGEYTGSLSLSPLVDGAPQIDVTLKSRASVFWAIALIAAGVMMAGWLSNHIGLRRRKRRVCDTLEDSVVSYFDDWGQLPDKVKRLVWSLDGTIKRDDQGKPVLEDPAWRHFDKIDNAGSVGAATHWARNDQDLDEAETAAVLIVERVNNWRLVANEVGLLHDAQEASPTGEVDGHAWDATRTARDTAVTLAAVSREPTDAKATLELHRRICRQVAWHTAFANAWNLYDAIASDPDGKNSLGGYDLWKLDQDAEPALTRTPEQQDELMYQLAVMYRKMHGVAARMRLASDLPPNLDAPISPPILDLDRAVKITARFAGSPAVTLQALDLARSDENGPVSPGRSSASFFKRLLLIDTLLSGVIILLTSVVYAIGKYDDTWGSAADLATAFGAGFTGLVAVKWAALPLYRSLRYRQTASKEPAAA